MKTYQVNFYNIYPECTETEDDILTAFVLASSFKEAQEKVEQRYKKQSEHAEVIAISLPKNIEIII